MRKLFAIIFVLLSFGIKSQVLIGTGGKIQNNGVETYFNLSVSGLNPGLLNNTFGVQEVCINISHSNVEELYIYLQSPGGTIVELTEGASCKGINYTSTCFLHNANTSITLGTAPYTGSYKPIGNVGRFQNGQTGNGVWKLIVKDYLAFVDSGSVINWTLNFGTSPAPPISFTSSNLPIVVINTNNQPITDFNTSVSMGIIYNGINKRNNLTNSFNNFNGKSNIHLRGNTSKNFEKKPYSLETIDVLGNELSVSLIGMPPENDWDLIAMYQDKSLIRIPLTYDLSRMMGHYAPRFKTVEVVVNNEYSGVYSLMEKPKWGNYRIDISKLGINDNSAPAITGGYIIKIDRADAAGWYSLFPGDPSGNSHFYYEYVYPKDTAITTQQKIYIKDFMDNFETVMNSPSFNDPTTGYQKYIDVESFIDYFIINELSKNVDAYRLSTYMYKDNINKGGKLHISPVWDYDLAWHNCNYGNSFDPALWQYEQTDTVHPTPNWWNRFSTDSYFVNKLYCRWTDLRQGILSINNLNTYIDSSANALNESQQRNFIQWPILGAYIYPNPQNQLNANYQGEVNDLKTWIANRAIWMDGAISGYCASVGIQENSFDNTVTVYPNPFESTTTFALNLTEEVDVSLKIIDVMGKEIALLSNERRQLGESKFVFERKERPAGIYFYQVTMNDIIKTGKIVIQ